MNLSLQDTRKHPFVQIGRRYIVRPRTAFRAAVSDFDGHYDIDGVSFQRGLGVIVASDWRTDFKINFQRLRESLSPEFGHS